MNGSLHALSKRPLAVTTAFALACLTVVSTAVPGYAVGTSHVQVAISALALGPAIVALGVFYSFSSDNRTWLVFVGAVFLVASLVGLFIGFLYVIGDTGPYLSPGNAGPNDIYLLVDNAIQFLIPTLVLSLGAFVTARLERTIFRLVALGVTTFVVIPASAVAATLTTGLVG